MVLAAVAETDLKGKLPSFHVLQPLPVVMRVEFFNLREWNVQETIDDQADDAVVISASLYVRACVCGMENIVKQLYVY